MTVACAKLTETVKVNAHNAEDVALGALGLTDVTTAAQWACG